MTWPTLVAISALPARVLVGDAYVITQGSGPSSVNVSLRDNVTVQPWAEAVSAEIFGLGTIRGQPLVLRAADPNAFLAIEGGSFVEESPLREGWALAGERLATRLGLRIGDPVSLVGSAVPRIEIVRVAGVFRVPGPANDELVVDYGIGRWLNPLGSTSFHAIRVRTSDPATLLEFLEAVGASLHVAAPDGSRVDIRSEPPTTDRLANLLLRTGRGPLPADALTIAVGDATNSVRVVALGIASLVTATVAFAVHSVQARAFADRSRSVGILRSVGASNGWMRLRILGESLPIALAAGVVGAVVGIAVDVVLGPAGPLLLFGHAVDPAFDAGSLALVVLATLAASTASSLLLLEHALRERPAESIREARGESTVSLEVVLRGGA